jgi:hypothetical protein
MLDSQRLPIIRFIHTNTPPACEKNIFPGFCAKLLGVVALRERLEAKRPAETV